MKYNKIFINTEYGCTFILIYIEKRKQQMTEEHAKSGVRNGELYIFDDYVYLYGILVGLCGPVILLMIVCHLYRFFCAYKLQSIQSNIEYSSNNNNIFPKKKYAKTIYYYSWTTHWIVMSAFLVALYDIAISILAYFHVNVNNILVNNCDLVIDSIALSWGYIKILLYFMSTLRLVISFKDTKYGYSSRTIFFIFMYVMLLVITGLICLVLWSDGISIHNANKDYYWCQYKMNSLFILVTMGLDITTNTLFLILFISPLLKLSNIASASEKSTIIFTYLYIITPTNSSIYV